MLCALEVNLCQYNSELVYKTICDQDVDRLNQSDPRQRQGGRGGGTGPDLSTAGVYRQHGGN